MWLTGLKAPVNQLVYSMTAVDPSSVGSESDARERRMTTAPQGCTLGHLHPHAVALLEVHGDHVGPRVQGLAAGSYPHQPPAAHVDVRF